MHSVVAGPIGMSTNYYRMLIVPHPFFRMTNIIIPGFFFSETLRYVLAHQAHIIHIDVHVNTTCTLFV